MTTPPENPLNVVTLREYMERLFDENDKAMSAALQTADKALAAARSHIEAIFEEHRRAHNQKHIDDERALEQAREATNLRLEKLNELRSEVLQDRGQFVRAEVYKKDIEQLAVSLNGLDKRAASQEAVDGFKRIVYGAVFTAALSIGLALFALVTR